jgi:hypothetical protein
MRIEDGTEENLPIPADMIKDALSDLDGESEKMLKINVDVYEILKKARKDIEPVINQLDPQVAPYDDFMGVDGGNSFPRFVLSGCYGSVCSVGYPIIADKKPFYKGIRLILPAGIPIPLEPYIYTFRELLEMEASLYDPQTDLVIRDGSLVPGIFARYARQHDEFSNMGDFPSFDELFNECFLGPSSLLNGILNSDPIVIGIPKQVSSSHFISRYLGEYGIPNTFNDLQIFSYLLKPGEYIATERYSTMKLSEGKNAELHLKAITTDFLDGRNPLYSDKIPEIVNKTLVTYFKPCAGAPAMRIEFLEKNKPELERILSTIKLNHDRTTDRPFVVHMADRLSKSYAQIPDTVLSLIRNRQFILAGERYDDDELQRFIRLGFSQSPSDYV